MRGGQRAAFGSISAKIQPSRLQERVSNRGQLHAAFDDSGGNGMTGESGGIVDVELLHEALAVLLDGFDAEMKLVGRLLVGLAFSNELQYFHLPGSQVHRFLLADQFSPVHRSLLLIVETLGNDGTEECVPFINFPDRLGEDLGGRLFDEIT